MDFDAGTPIWMQVAARIKSEMVSGAMKPGDKLPGGRELALRYTINPNTAARVYQELEKEGLTETRRGMGTYVTEDAARIEALHRDMAREAVNGYLSAMSALGFTKKEAVELLKQEEETC